ncbi:hypothetical protein AAFF_G00351670 [Aldrovandia affinis]|uniref:Uncharacterized protein n=1 Tax=Aldrovandia affinis TaxID=143900 RepID=A0AAD7WNP4_9TELE|nr:hypothetical protein AAFF_G00351670 [Aldrovandia affinis]
MFKRSICQALPHFHRYPQTDGLATLAHSTRSLAHSLIDVSGRGTCLERLIRAINTGPAYVNGRPKVKASTLSQRLGPRGPAVKRKLLPAGRTWASARQGAVDPGDGGRNRRQEGVCSRGARRDGPVRGLRSLPRTLTCPKRNGPTSLSIRPVRSGRKVSVEDGTDASPWRRRVT